MTFLTVAEFAGLFDTFTTEAFRLETRDFYNVDSEHEPMRRYLAGDEDDTWMDDFLAQVRAWAGEGKRLRRVRVVTEPHTTYVRWSLHVARLNIAAGEDIRYLPRAAADRLGLPAEDYWVFDDTRVAVLQFDDDARLTGVHVLTDAEEVARRLRWRDVAWAHATPRDAYV